MMLILSLLLGVGNAYAQTNVPVCQDGVVRLAAFLTDPAYMGAGNDAPPGHLQKGYWSNTAGLTFSNINDPNAIISGFPSTPGATFTLTWYHGLDQEYDITVVVTSNVSPEFELRNESNTTDNVLFCPGTTPNNYTFSVVAVNPVGAPINGIDYIIYHTDGSTDENGGATNPETINLNASINYTDGDVFHALVESGACLDITTNKIQLAELSSVNVQVQGGGSACDPSIFDGTNVLEVTPYDPINFEYTWFYDGGAGATQIATGTDTYTIKTTDNPGDYYVRVRSLTSACADVFTPAVTLNSSNLPLISIDDNPVGSGLYELCDGDLAGVLSTTLGAGTVPAVIDYDWYHNGVIVTGDNNFYNLDNNSDPLNVNYNAYGEYYVVLKDAGNTECKSTSLPVTVITTRLDDVVIFKANNATPFCASGTPEMTVNVTGGTAPYTLTFASGYSTVLAVNGSSISLPIITADTSYDLVSVTDGAGCTWAGSKVLDYTVSPLASILELAGNPSPACAAGAGLTISLPATAVNNTGENGISYQLQRDKDGDGVYEDNIGVLTGDGVSAIQWPTQVVPGTYRVIANGCTGDVEMTNTYVLEDEPIDKPFLTTGNVCLSGQVEIPNSETGIRYSLYRQDRTSGIVSYTGISRIGDGNTVSFPLQVTDGVYTVEATSLLGGCSFFMSASLTIINPVNYNLTALGGVTSYCQGLANSGIILELGGSQPGNSYQLRRDTGTGFANYGTAQGSGVGSALQWTDVPFGTYEVLVTTPEGCSETMGLVVITETPLPTATISIDPTDNSKCDGTNQNFNPVIDFTGVAPFTFTISDDKTPANTWTLVSNSDKYTGFFIDPSSTTTYTVTQVIGGNGCVGTGAGAATITVKESPTVTITGNSDVCSGQSVVLTANPNITGAGLAITGVLWGNGATSNAITVSPSSDQLYSVTTTANNGCQTTATHNVTVNPLPVITFSALAPFYCEDNAPVPMDASPTGGTYYVNGNPLAAGITSFDPGNPAFLQDDNTIYYEVTDVNGCSSTATIPDVDVKPMPTPQINNLPLTICSDAGAQVIYGLPAGGTFNVLGAGLDYTVTGNQMTINPGTSSSGFPYTIEYEYSDGFGCTVTASQTTEILNFNVGVLTLNSNPVMALPLCQDDNTDYDLTGLVAGITVTAAGGNATITGNGVTDNGDGTAVFNATAAGPGQHPVNFTYSNNGCSSSITMIIDVGVTMTLDLASSYCEGVAVQTITATPDGGTFSIKEPGGNITSPPNLGGAPAGTEQFSFDPTGLASVGKTGTYEISYSIDDGAGCVTTQTWTTSVGAAVDASFTGLPLNACVNDAAYTLTPNYAGGGTPTILFTGNGIVSNIGVFSPSAAGVGTHTITCTVNLAGSCQSVYTQDVTVVGTPNIDIINLADAYCSDDAAVLISASNAGDAGTYTFSSTTSPSAGNPNPLTYTAGDQSGTFNPAVDPALLSWTYYVTYTFTPSGLGAGCVSEITKPVTIYRNEAVDYSGLTEAVYCQGDAIFEIEGSEAGGEFYIDGVLGNGLNGLTNTGGGKAEVNPSLLSVGNHTITYSYERVNPLKSCTNTRDRSFDIIDGPVGTYNVTGGGPYCLGGAGVTVSLDGSTAGVDYELYLDGNPMAPVQIITGPAAGGQIDFTNLTATGTYTIIARQNTCERMMTGSAYVNTYDLNLGLNYVSNVTCNGGTDGVVNLQGTGGSGAYAYYISDDGGVSWTLNTNTVPNEFVNLGAGTYNFRIIDMDVDAPCVLDAARNVQVTINEPGNALVVNPTEIQKVGCNCAVDPLQCDGIGSISISGGTQFTDLTTYPSGYDIIWPASVTNLSADKLVATNLSAGTYSITVIDALGCSSTVNLVIANEPALSLIYDSQVDNLCYGTDIASATVTAAGGSGLYEYSLNADENWLAGAANYTTPTLSTGWHTIWVRDANHPNCQLSVNANITGPASPLDLTLLITDETCATNNDGTAELQITGGVGPYEYELDLNPRTTVPAPIPVLSGLSVGPHTVTIYDDNNCSITKSFTISPATAISLSGVATPVSCYSGNDGKVVLTANPANVNYVYSVVAINGVGQTPVWQASNEFTGLDSEADLAKNYSFQVKDNVNNCTSAIINIDVLQPQNFVTTHTKTDVVCAADENGTITLATEYADGSPGAFEYSIDGGANWQVSPLTNLKSGFYNIRVRDLSTACEVDYGTTVEIQEPLGGQLVINPDGGSKLALLCHDDGDGVINVDMANSGWNTNYSYQWRDKATNENFGTSEDLNSVNAGKAVPGGTYVLTVTDDNGCSVTYEQIITEPLPWSITIITTPNTITNAASDVAIIGDGSANLASVSGGSNSENYGYKWYDSTGTEIPGTEDATTINNLDPGNYYIEITDKTDGCSERRDFTIGDVTVPLNATVNFFDPECADDNGRIEVSVLGGVPDYTIKYKRNADPQQTLTTANTFTEIIGTPGSYTVIIEDSNGGSIEETGTINAIVPITITGNAIFTSNCESTISVTPVVPAGVGENYTASWIVPAGAPTLPDVSRTSADNAIAISQAVSIPGDYTLVVKHDTKSCFESFTVTVEDPTISVTEDLVRHKNVSCNGGLDAYLAVNVSGREPGHVFNYVWQNTTTGAAAINTGNRNTLGDSEDVDAGLWTVTVQTFDGTCEETVTLVEVTQPAVFSISNVTPNHVTSCDSDNSGSLLVEVAGGTLPYTVSITDGVTSSTQSSSSSSFTFNNLIPGTYTITAQDANNCGLPSVTEIVNAPDPIVVTNFDGTIDCNPANVNGTISFSVSGGVQAPGNISSYAIIIEGDNGFSYSTVLDVDWDVAVNPYPYSFDNGIGLTPGTYTVKLWDANASAGTNVSCPIPVFEQSTTLEHIYITEDVTHVTCSGGTSDGSISNFVITGISSNVSYTWDDIGVVTLLSDRTGLAPGTYKLTLSDLTRGCNVEKTYVINDGHTLQVSSFTATDVSCFGGTDGRIELLASPAGGNYVFSIDGGLNWQSSNVFENLSAAAYPARVRDLDYGCESADVNITVAESPEITIQGPVKVSDIICLGGSDAAFTAGATDGMAGTLFEYAIETNGAGVPVYQDSPTFSGLSSGVYHLWVRRKSTNCEVYQSDYYTVSEPTNGDLSVVIDAGSKLALDCFGDNDGIINVAVTGGWGNVEADYTYEWRNVETNALIANTQDISNLIAGTYVLTVSDNNGGCSTTFEQIITSPLEWDVSISTTDNTIPNTDTGASGNGTATLSPVSGGSIPATYEFDWYLSDGTLISTDKVTTTLSELQPGDYYVIITGAATCTKRIDFTIGDASKPLAISTSHTDASCNGDLGTIRVTMTSGTAPYDITIQRSGYPAITVNTNSSSYLFENLIPGEYDITVEDALTGVVSGTEEILEPAAFTVSASVDYDNCLAELTVDIVPADDYLVSWVVPSGATAIATTDFNGTQVVEPNISIAGDYLVSVTNKNTGCIKTTSIVVEEPSFTVVENVSQRKDVSCYGGNDGYISVSTIGREPGHLFTYEWTNGTDTYNTGIVPSIGSSDPVIAGTWSVTVTTADGKCSQTLGGIVINEPGELVVNTIDLTHITTCAGDNSGQIEIVVSGGSGIYNLDYTGDNVTDLTSADGTFSISNLFAGDYQLRVSDSNACVTTPVEQTVTILEPNALTIAVDNVNTIIDCITDGTGQIQFDVSGGNMVAGKPLYDILLTGQPPREDIDSEGTVTYNNLTAGIYTITVIDKQTSSPSTCTVAEETVVLELITISGTEVPNACSSTTNNIGAIRNISITGASPGASWSWDEVAGDPVTDNTQLNQENLPEGTYVLRVDDTANRGCVVTKTFTIGTLNTLDILGNAVDVTCNGANDGKISGVTIIGSANYDYLWTGSGTVDNTRIDAQENLEPGTYTLTITDRDNGCTYTKDWTIAEPQAITYTLEYVVENCSPYNRGINVINPLGGNAAAAGDYTYTWIGPDASLVQGQQNQTGLVVGGTYTVTVADNACGVSKSIVVPEEVLIVGNVSELTCNGSNSGAFDMTVTGGTGNFTYVWEREYPAGTTNVIEGPDTDITNIDLSGQGPGVYTLTLTDNSESDGSACVYTWSYELVEPSPIVINGSVTDLICNGDKSGQIAINVSGGAGDYSYNWTTADGSGLIATNQNQTGLTGGTYSVQVRDANGCVSSIVDFTVTEPAAVDFTINETPTDCDGTNGAIDITPGGGSGNYAYYWSASDGGVINPANANDQDQTGLPGGTYLVRVWDADPVENRSACFVEKEIILTKAITLDINVSNQACAGTENGQIDINISGGVGPYTFDWTTVSGNAAKIIAGAQNQSGLSAGEYRLRVTDSRTPAACWVEQTIFVNTEVDIQVNANLSEVTCYSGNDGAITLSQVTGGSGSYGYVWSGPSGSAIIQGQRNQSGLIAGEYRVIVNDMVSGCAKEEVFTLAQAPELLITLDNLVDVECKGQRTGEITVSVTGGTLFAGSNYQYLWTGPDPDLVQNVATQTNLLAGDYTLVVRDDNNCSSTTLNVSIAEPAEELTASLLNITDVSVPGGNDGAIEITVSGGTGNKSIAWTGVDNASAPIAGITQNTVNPGSLIAGIYAAVITDDNGCSVTIDNIKVSEPDEALSMTVSKKDIQPCNGAANGEISVTANGGEAPYNIMISNSGGSVVGLVNADALRVVDLEQGIYTIRITDNKGTVINEAVTITEPAALSISASVTTPVDCTGDATGVIRYQINGGIADASNHYKVIVRGAGSYNQSFTTVEANTNYDITGLEAGEYTLQVIDDVSGTGAFIPGDNCDAITSVTIAQPEAIVSIANDANICIGESANVLLSVGNYPIGTGANSLDVTLSDGTTHTLTSATTNITVTPATTGVTVYSVSAVENGGCIKGNSDGSEATIVVNELPVANISLVGIDNAICSGESVQLQINVTVGQLPCDVVYTDGTSNTTVTVNQRLTTISVSPTTDTSYELVSVSDANCTGTVSGIVDVIVNELPSVTMAIDAANTTICFGDASELIFTFPTGSPDYQVTYSEDGVNKTVNAIPLGAGNEFRLAVNPIETTVYQLISVSDNNGCDVPIADGTAVTVNVQQNPQDAGTITGDMIVCQGSTQTYTIDPITGATSYDWTVPASLGTIVSGNGTTTITVVISTAFTGNTDISVRGINACNDGLASSLGITASLLPAKPDAPTSSGSLTICEGQTGMRFSTNPVANAGSYSWTIPDGLEFEGVSDGTEVVLNVKDGYNNFSGEIRVTAINDCGNSEGSDPVVVTVNPLPVANAGTDIYGVCSDTHQLNATNPGAGYTGRWTVISGTAQIVATDINNPNANVTGISIGESVFRWTVTNNTTLCVNSDEVSLFNDQLSISVGANVTSTCDGTIVVNGTPVDVADGQSGYWTITSGGGNVTTPTIPNEAVITDLAVGLNTIEWTLVKNGCESKASVDVMNNLPTEPEIFNSSGIATTLIDLNCQDDFTTVSGTAPGAGETGTWNVVAGSAAIAPNINASTINLSDIPHGETQLTWTIQNGSCIRVATVTIRNNALNVDASDDVSVCGDVITLGGTVPGPGVTGQWSIPAGMGTGVFDSGTSPTATISNLGRGANTLRWTLTKNGCSSYDDVIVTNNSATEASVGTRQEICAYETVLTGNVPSAALGETGFWSVLEGSGVFDDETAHDTRVSGLANGLNVFRWTIKHSGCTSSADIEIYNKHVDVFAGKDTVICSKSVTLTANVPNPGDVGQWTLISGIGGGTFKPGDETSPVALVGALDYGDNGFVWTIDHDGCTSSDEIIVTNNNPYYLQEDPIGSGIFIKKEISAGDDRTVSGSNIYLAADEPAPGAGSGYWTIISGGGTIVDPDNAGSQVTDLRMGESIFRWTVTNGICSYYSDVTVTNGAIEDANAGRDGSTCTSEYKLNANEPINALGEWSVIEGSGVFADKTDFNTMVTGLDEGENHFKWTLYNGSTESSDIVIITNNVVAEAYAGLDKSICNTDEFELSAIAPVAGRGAAQWTVISGSGSFDDDTSPSTYIRGLSQGVNTLKYKITLDECSSEAFVTITNNTPTTPDAGEDRVMCIDSVQLLPNTPAYGVGEWSVASGYAEPDALENDWAKRLAPGENRLVWTINNNNCILSDEVIITNNEPDQPNAGEDVIEGLCVDHTFLDASTVMSGRGVGRWELVAGSGSVTDPADPKSEVTGLGLGVNRFRWIIDNNGCISSDEVNISNNHIEAIAGNDQVLCADTATLKANSAHPGTGTWGVRAGAGSASFDDPSSPFTKVRGLQQGDNVLLWTINYGGCSHSSEVTITNDSPSAAFAGDNQSLCASNSTTLTANHPSRGTGEWSIINGSATFGTSALDNNPTVNDLAFGDNVFRWTITNNSCSSISDVMISYNRIDAAAGSDKDLCTDEVQLEGNTAKPGTGTWSVVGGTSQAMFEDVNNPKSKVSKLAKGVNVLRWTINYRGCETESEVRMTNNSPSEAYAGNYQEICVDYTDLDATLPAPGVGTWEVLMGSGNITDPTDAKSAVTSLSKGDNVFRWTVTNGICTSTDEVRIVNNQPSVPYAGSDEEICYNSYTLKAEEPLFGAGLWSIENGAGNFDDPTNPTATISNLNPGDNMLKWTITQGQCELSHYITITNNAADEAHAGPDIIDCKDWSELDANIPISGLGIGEWTLVSGKGDFDDVTEAKTTIRNLGFGENILMWTITNGDCFTSDQVTIFNKIPDQAAAGDDRTTCENYIVLNANNPVDGSGTWTVVSGKGMFENKHQHNTMVTDVGYGENIYKWTISYGDCTTEDVVSIVSNKADPYAGEDDVTYEPVYTLQAQNPGALNGVWTIVAGGGTFDDPGFFNTSVRDLPVGKSTFRWTITTDGCEAYDEVTIEYKEVPDAGFTVSDEEGCFPLEIKFTNYSVGGNGHSWDFGDGGTSTERNPVYTYQTPGTYTAVLTVAGPDGNDAVFTQRIVVHNHPVADFNVGPEIVYLPQEEIRCYDMSVDAVSWLWEFGDGQTSQEQNPTYTYSKEGVYSITLTVQNAWGCENSFTKDDAVEAINSGYIEFPNAFMPRPGGAGNSGTIGERKDAIFKAKSKDVEVFNIQIFNRWGQLIYESNDVDEGWDGTFQGQLVPQAVYVYKAFVRYTNGREENKAGSVLLVR
ncbi:PKD domain-containing protein [Carboxylicivirga sp. RSCT41]|uniref:PKD domain-containing protein n=1 Tax=Carboxylicivirga agarovorans TaxID=3417570 RepID=UPI003D333F7B